MRRIKLELCYDGADYSGWQIQPKQPQVKTIQGELQRAIARELGLSLCKITRGAKYARDEDSLFRRAVLGSRRG